MKTRFGYLYTLAAVAGFLTFETGLARASVFDVSTDNTTDNWNAATRWTLISGSGSTPLLNNTDSVTLVNTSATTSIVAMNLGSATLASLTFGTSEAGTNVSRTVSFRSSGTSAQTLTVSGNLTKYDTGTLQFYSIDSSTGSLAVRVNGDVNVNAGIVSFGRSLQANLVGLTIDGTTSITGGTVNVRSSTDSSLGALSMTGGALNLCFLTVPNGARTISVRSLDGTGGTIGQETTGTGAVMTLAITGSATTSFSGTISNGAGTSSVALSKSGSGVQTLSGTNTYTGATTVSAGTLLINGSTASGSAVSVTGGSAASAVLGGTGTIGGSVSFTTATGGILAVGGAGTIGNLATGAVSATLASNISMELNAAATSSDLLKSSGLTATNFTLNLTNLGGTFSNGQSFQLFQNQAGGAPVFSGTTFAAIVKPTLTGGLTWDESALYTSGTLSVVPEPATWGLLAFSLTTVMVLRRRCS